MTLGASDVDVITKDCTALGDAEMGEMADLSAATEGWEVGLISKQAEEWVLVSRAFRAGKLEGFVMASLERIGGTPALVIGLAHIRRGRSRASVLNALMSEQFHKARMAFPDEDVIVSTRMAGAGPMEAFAALRDVRPWPDTRVNGEERAWGRRLAKRFGATGFDDRTMVARDDERLVFDHETMKSINVGDVFTVCDDAATYVVAWGWAMAEFLDGHVERSV